MAVQMISLTCPQCGANLEVASDREFLFCEFCGRKIAVADSNHQRYTYRQIDDARIKEADVQESIRLRELEIELIRMQDESRRKKFAIYAKLVVIFAFLLITALPVIMMKYAKNGASEISYLMLAVAMAIVTAVALPKMFRS